MWLLHSDTPNPSLGRLTIHAPYTTYPLPIPLSAPLPAAPLRRVDPSDLKGAVVLLGSDASKYITGAEIVIDGGYTCL
jgi:NAD(P)-dependent dehydrogenase (short-subunit alcohol dehydrogenase family)